MGPSLFVFKKGAPAPFQPAQQCQARGPTRPFPQLRLLPSCHGLSFFPKALDPRGFLKTPLASQQGDPGCYTSPLGLLRQELLQKCKGYWDNHR